MENRKCPPGLASFSRAYSGGDLMPLPLPAGPDYPLWMPPDGLTDRTRGAITDRPHAARRSPRTPEGEGTHRASGHRDGPGSIRTSFSK